MMEHRRTSLGALLFIACGVGGLVAVSNHPESLNGPLWVGWVACSTFVLAGLAVLCQANGFPRVGNVLVLAILVALFAVGAWVAFGAGPRMCTVALPFVTTLAGETLCRGAFGLGALLVGLMALWQFVRILRGKA